MKRGEHDVLAAVCEGEYPRLVGLLALRVRDVGIAEQLAQEALVQLCQRWPEVERPEAWLTRVALNLSTSWVRRKVAERRAYRRHGTTEVSVSAPPTADQVAIRDAVSLLPERQQVAVILRYYEQLSVAETAELMACPPGTVKSLCHRALVTLRGTSGLTHEEVLGHA